jgi:hypothetical protein
MYFYAGTPRTFDFPTIIPLVREKDPGKIEPLALRPLAMADGAGSRIPAAPATGSAGEECVEACKLTRDRFASLIGVEGLLAGVGGGTRRRPPLD